jgi:GNAT superfamily N-acetyltransferase
MMTTTNATRLVPSVPPLGQDATYSLMLDTGYILRVHHGSSPLLMSRVHDFLTEKDDHGDCAFGPFDPMEDRDKWSRRGMMLYYVAVVDPALGIILCALRAATEGIMMVDSDNNNNNNEEQQPSTPLLGLKKKKKRKLDGCRRRLLIDYLYTTPEAQNEGIAGLLVPKVLALAQGAPCFVVSLQESQAYWGKKHHFHQCYSPGLDELMNLFRDTTLLQQQQPWGEDTREEEDVVEEDCYQRVRLKRYRCSHSQMPRSISAK